MNNLRYPGFGTLLLCLLITFAACNDNPSQAGGEGEEEEEGGNETPSLTISSVDPDSAAAGAEVVITGTAFNSSASANTVLFNGTPGSVESATETELTVTVPFGASSGTIEVSNGDETADGPAFTVLKSAVQMITQTTGEDQDRNGYTLIPDFIEEVSLGINDTSLVSGLDVNTYGVEISGLENNCSLSGNNPKTFDTIAQDTVEVIFAVACENVVLADKIVYSKTNGQTQELYYMDTDGSNQTLLTSTYTDQAPAFAPDGESIAFHSTNRDDDQNFELFLIDASGYPTTQLTQTSSSVTNYRPAWSPDGSKLAFIQSGVVSGFEDVVTMNADGTGLDNLTSNSPSNDSNPDWSPDGTKIAFGSDRGAGSYSIFVMNSDGSSVSQLTSGDNYDDQPSWSPDGTKIVFFGIRNGNNDILIMDADGSNITALTNDTNDDSFPTWSPDGTKIIFQRKVNGQFDIFSINPDGTGLTNLTSSPQNEWNPHWSPAQ